MKTFKIAYSLYILGILLNSSSSGCADFYQILIIDVDIDVDILERQIIKRKSFENLRVVWFKSMILCFQCGDLSKRSLKDLFSVQIWNELAKHLAYHTILCRMALSGLKAGFKTHFKTLRRAFNSLHGLQCLTKCVKVALQLTWLTF